MRRRTGERTQQHIADALYQRRKVLAELVRSRALGEGDVAAAVRQITETAADLLEVERASVWRLVDDGAAIECVDLFSRGPDHHEAGVKIRAVDAPRYFAALQRERSIAAHDAHTDPRTAEFRDGYLVPHGITAMLDAPVFVRGQMVGVVCHEHVGAPRQWEFFEELLAGTFADFVALVIETAAWQTAEDALRNERDALEDRVAERTIELAGSEKAMRLMLDRSPIAMVLTRATDHSIVYANRRAFELFAVGPTQLAGLSAAGFWVDPDERQAFLAALAGGGQVEDLEVRLRNGAGRAFWCRLSATRLPYRGADTLLGQMIDVDAQRQAQAQLAELATHDELTGTFNRRHVDEVVRRELDRARRYGRPLTIGILDADHFKRINDGHGHQAGDEVLRAVAARCRDTLRASDVLGRYGGEEFVMVFPETSLAEAGTVAERVRAAVAGSPVVVGARALDVTVSIGLAGLAAEHADPNGLLASADAALYAAKQSGRNRVLTAS
jgi:diguanylate cyclase (GGDEF)-like protein/PAS domain S-box-containing protein